METVFLFSESDRVLLTSLVNELRRYNDLNEGSSDRLLSVSEAAEVIGVRRQTVSRYLRQGRLHKVSRGGKSGILLSEATRNNCQQNPK